MFICTYDMSVVERTWLPPRLILGGDSGCRLLHPGVAMVRHGNRPLHHPRNVLEEGVGMLSPRGESQISGGLVRTLEIFYLFL